MKPNKNKKTGITAASRAFTLIEIVIVLAVVVMLFGVGLGGMLVSQRQLIFLNGFNQTLMIVRDQRSLAIAGKALPDYTDYDKDGCKAVAAPPTCPVIDLVTPANYGVSFDFAVKPMTVTMFADLHKGEDTGQIEGEYEPPIQSLKLALNTYVSGSDLAMAQYALDSRLGLISNLFKSPNTRVDIFYSPIFGDFSVKPALDPVTQKFLILGVEDKQRSRKMCVKIHPVAGVPETAPDTECINPA